MIICTGMQDIRPFIVTGLALGSIYALSGIGIVVLHRATAVINLAYGAIGALGALVAWSVVESGQPEALAWLACLGVTTGVSVLYGSTVAGRLAGRDQSTKAVATVGLAVLILGFCNWWLPDDARTLSLPTSRSGLRVAGVQVVYTRILALGVALVIVAALGVFLSSTRIGLHMRAVADDPAHAAMLGVRTERVGAVAWAISGAMAGITGLLIADLIRLDASTLTFLVVPALAAALIGRLVSLPVTLVGGIGIGLLESTLAPFDSVGPYRGVAPFAIAIIALAVRHGHSDISVVASPA